MGKLEEVSRQASGLPFSVLARAEHARATSLMTISADGAADGDRLERTLALYRDLTVALRDRLTLLETGADWNEKETADDVRRHRNALQTVLDIEASLGKRTKATDGGAGLALDLDAARAEVVERLAVWAARR